MTPALSNGETAEWTITLSPAPQSATDVNVTVSATGNVVLPVNQGADVVQSVGTGGTAAYSVATVSGEAGQCNAGDCRRRVLHWVAVVCGGERVALFAVHGGREPATVCTR